VTYFLPTLGSTQHLVKMSIRNISGGKGGRCVRLKNSPPSRAECHEIWEPKPPGTLWATPGLLRNSFLLSMCIGMRSLVGRKVCSNTLFYLMDVFLKMNPRVFASNIKKQIRTMYLLLFFSVLNSHICTLVVGLCLHYE
jgi:hypothetical protein